LSPMNSGSGAGSGNLGTPETVLRTGDLQAIPRSVHPGRIEKPWGYELIWAHADEYVGKLLFIRAGEALSLQFHEEKDETLYLMEGTLRLELGAGVQSLQLVELPAGQSIRIPPGVMHRMTAVTDCTLFEASTPELDDVVRVRDRYGRAPSGEPAPP